MEMEAVHVHERLNKALDILNALNFQGYHEITAIAPKVGLAMGELILLEQEFVKFEQEQKKQAEAEDMEAAE